MEFPIGGDNFGDVQKNKLDFVDKSLFIKDIIDRRGVSVSVITRPRRFGKTFNLSMLQHFLASEVNGLETKHLFDGLKISKIDHGLYMQKQGKFPVIFISFKGLKKETYESFYEGLYELVLSVLKTHNYLLTSDKLSIINRDLLQIIVGRKANQSQIENFLQVITSCLFEHHGVKPWLLIDEYDTPIQAGYLNNYYAEIIDIMRGIFGAALKSNPYLDRAVVTGILRIAKESLFSGVNNLVVYSMLDQRYGEYFGFTEAEVSEVLQKMNLGGKEEEVKHWYNGYVFAGATVYNPWSIVNYVMNNGAPRPYWVNTSDNALIKTVLIESDIEFKKQMGVLMQGKSISVEVDPNMVFGDLKSTQIDKVGSNSKASWSLLLMSGYLKIISDETSGLGYLCECAIPNEEIRLMYCDIIKNWLGNGGGSSNYQNFLRYLLAGDIEGFSRGLNGVFLQTLSSFDAAYNPEAFYHGFMLGLLASLDKGKYELRSNRESGDGRYDVSILPKDTAKPAIILEFKASAPAKAIINANDNGESLEIFLEQDARDAYEQIIRNKYEAECNQRGYKNIVKIGMAFYGKKVQICSDPSIE